MSRFYPFLVLLIVSIIAYFIHKRAKNKLEAAKKKALVNLYSKSERYNLGILAILLIFIFADFHYQWINSGVANTFYSIVLALFIIISMYLNYRVLKENDFPNSYIRMNLLSTLLRSFGFIAVIIWITYY